MLTAIPTQELPRMNSSIRGVNIFLSSLRVFANQICANIMTEERQNIVLSLVHQLTRFMPAVRATRVLMDGKTLQPLECAAIVQSFAEILQDLVPKGLIENDPRRYLEGTRLLLGFILLEVEKLSKNTKNTQHGDNHLPYLKHFKTVDLRDVRTNEIVLDPVQTDLGLMERGSFDAFKPGGILGETDPGNGTNPSDNPDHRALRATILNGGCASESSYYDTDNLEAALTANHGTLKLLGVLQEFSRNLPDLAGMCHKTSMTVVHPRSLKTATAPVLTLDRDGSLSVYVGRAACAAPDRDISIFRPVAGREEAIDVNIVTQLIEPLVQAREQDGTLVFDLFGNSTTLRSGESKPTELLMFCVDCSESMDYGSDFQEIQEGTVLTPFESILDDVPVTGDVDDPISLEDVKEWLTDHESFDDMLAIVASTSSYRKRAMAEEVLEFATLLASRELRGKSKEYSDMRSWATRLFLLNGLAGYELRMVAIRKVIGGLNFHKAALCDFIIFKAQGSKVGQSFTWTYGQPIPSTESGSPPASVFEMTEESSIPSDIICPISQAVFEDPVTTSDNFTYDRRSIERWFQIRQSSPSTGLPLQDTTLRRNQPLYEQTTRWLSGEDIMQAAPPAPKRSRLANRATCDELTLNFVTPAGTFTRKVPPTLSLTNLYKLAYRGMRGLHKSFALHVNGAVLESSERELRDRRIASGSQIVVNIHPAPGANLLTQDSGEMCLIKVYTSCSATSETFAYWVPEHTTVSFASILFRNWRFQLRRYRLGSAKDQEMWSNLRYGGDSIFIGTRHDHWDSLGDSLSDLPPREVVRDEPICANSSSKDSDNDESESFSGGDDESEPALGTNSALYRVLKVELSSYKDPESTELARKEKLRGLTRLAVSKQVFGAFINRLIAYNYPTAIGLVSFGTSPKLAQPLTGIIENFRHAIDTLASSGDTSLWDALAVAADQLVHFGQKYPGIQKRIICLSDGNDTKSKTTVNAVCRRLIRDRIIVDSCSIGSEDNSDLRTLSFLTGGYKFVPKTLEQAVAICELEPVLSIHERPPAVRPVIAPLLTSGSFSLAAEQAVPDLATRDHFPARKSHPNLDDNFVRITAFERSTQMNVTPLMNDTPMEKSASRQRRLLAEIRNIASNPHPSYDVYVSESNMGFWKVVLSGPSESAYETGTFVLYLDMGDNYPQSPPQARFITRIFHPNINLGGRCCHSIFDRNWAVDTTNKQVLDTVFGLMLTPEFSDPINTVVTLNFYWDEVAFREEVKKHIEKYARKGREELGREILGE
jgi:ubiquitin-protein ligase